MKNSKLIVFYVDDLNNKKIIVFTNNPYEKLNNFLKEYGDIYKRIKYCFKNSLDITNKRILLSKFVIEEKTKYIETGYENLNNLPKELFKEILKDL